MDPRQSLRRRADAVDGDAAVLLDLLGLGVLLARLVAPSLHLSTTLLAVAVEDRIADGGEGEVLVRHLDDADVVVLGAGTNLVAVVDEAVDVVGEDGVVTGLVLAAIAAREEKGEAQERGGKKTAEAAGKALVVERHSVE